MEGESWPRRTRSWLHYTLLTNSLTDETIYEVKKETGIVHIYPPRTVNYLGPLDEKLLHYTLLTNSLIGRPDPPANHLYTRETYHATPPSVIQV